MKNLLYTLLLVSSAAIAVPVNLSWTNPTHNDDATPELPEGTPIPLTGPEALQSVNIYWSICDPNDEVIITPGLDISIPETVPGDPGATSIDIGTPGRWCFIATATNASNGESRYSNVVVKNVIIPPAPPTGLVVDSSNLLAYYVSLTSDRIVLVPVGTVPIDTPCDGTQSVNGHYLVPRDNVAWVGSLRPAAVFALCQ